MDDDDMDSKRDEHIKHLMVLQLIEFLPKLRVLGISFSDDDNVFSVLCRPCNKCISKSNRAKLSNLQQHLEGKNHRAKVTISTNFENWIVEKKWEKVGLDANGFLMFQRENSGITTDKPPVESITEQEKKVSQRNTSLVMSVNLSQIFYANTIKPLKIGYLCYACAIILNPTPTSKIMVSHLTSTQHVEKLLQWFSTRMEAKLLDIPSDLAPLFSENILQHKQTEIYCIACSAHLPNINSLIDHTNSEDHTKKLNSFMQTISTGAILNREENLTNKDFQPSLSTAASCKLSLPNVKTRDSTDLKPPLVQTSDKLLLLKRNQYITGANLHCEICHVDLYNPGNISPHINGKKHKTQLHGLLQSIEHNNIDMNPIIKLMDTEHDQKCLQPERFLLDTPIGSVNNDIRATVSISTRPAVTTAMGTSTSALISTSSAVSSTPSLYNLPTKDSTSEQLNCMIIPDELKPLISQHFLQHSKKGMYCAACTVDLETVESLINHTKNNSHTKKLNLFMQAISTETNLDVGGDSTTKDFRPSSSAGAKSTLSLEGYIIGKNFYCKICRVDLNNSGNILSHINGTNHQTQLHKFKVILQTGLAKPPNKSNRTEAIDASTDDCDNSSTASKNSENPFLQSIQSYNIGTNPIVKPMNTECDQKYLQQERPLLDRPNGSLNNDIHTTVPLSTSPEFTTAISTSITSALISTSSAASSIPSLCNSAINGSISDQPNLMKIPDELKPLISKHLLQHLETEIYCDTCSVHLHSAQSVREHTKSRNHKLNLKDRIKREKLESKLKMIEEKLREVKCLTSNHPLPDTNTPLRETKQIKNSTKAGSMYSSIDINEIYRVSSEKLRIIEMSCQLCFPKSPQRLYCLICEKSTSNNLQNFYEHMFSHLHLQYFSDLEANDLLYVDYPNQFSNLTLLKEFIMELTDETFQCVICDSLVLNLDAEISVHIKQEKHIIQKQRLNKLSKEKFLKTVLQHTQSYHDNINVYWCELCDFSSDSAFAFAKHSSDPTDNACLEQRSSHECDIIYDSCVPCASLWLGFMHTYARHCEEKSHKHNVQDYQIIKEITLPREAIIYLKHAVQKVEELIQLSDQVVTKEQSKVHNLLKCLEKTVKPVFPKAKAYPFGSRMSGLGFPDSDIDVFLDCGTYFGTTVSEKEQQRIIDEVTYCLHGNKKLWKIEEVLTSGRIPIIKLYHQSTELKCDISFKNGLSVENTKLLKCYVDNCPMVRRLILFLKKWLAICKLSGSRYITNYALCWYVIFYLQSKTILPSVADLIRQGKKSKTVAGWETGICEKFVPRMPDDSFLSLLQGFFKYYAIFNFRKCVACPLLGYTVHKDDFEDLSSLPLEMAPYINHLRATIDHTQLFRIDSSMCIQDPYDLAHNLTKAVSKLDLGIFKQFCEASAEVLNSDFKMP